MANESAKEWCRANGLDAVASEIERLEAKWKASGSKTRRNWWETLAGRPDGTARTVDGVRFPVIAEARIRQGLPLSTPSSSSLPGLEEPAGAIGEEEFADTTDIEPTASPDGPSAPVPRPSSAPTPDAAPPVPKGPESSHVAPAVVTSAVAPSAPLLDGQALTYLDSQLRQGRVLLFTGAGFSASALDREGRSLPIGSQLGAELSELCFPGEPSDGGAFGDLYAVAQRRHARELRELLERRLTVDPETLPAMYGVWLSQPWQRVYTLNYDTLATAADQRFALPRKPIPTSATSQGVLSAIEVTSAQRLSVVHLNGRLGDELRDITADPESYGVRLGRSEPWYELFVAELAATSCVFVGSELDESLLWKYLQLRSHRTRSPGDAKPPRSFLVLPRLNKAKQARLADIGVTWVKSDAADFAAHVLTPLADATRVGLERLRAQDPSIAGSVRLPEVSELLRTASRSRTEFLSGEQPVWGDIATQRHAVRDADRALHQAANAALAEARGTGRARRSASVLLISGTAGSGKSTSLMHLCGQLSSEGRAVGWVDPSADLGYSQLRKAAADGGFNCVAVDNLDSFGRGAATFLETMASIESLSLVVAAVRSSKVETLGALAQNRYRTVTEFVMPGLTDPDIDALLAALDREHRLGALTGMSVAERRQQFQMRADRQLLVAMIEATSGRRFDEKVLDEWRDLPDLQKAAYAVVALSNALRESLTMEDLLLALSGAEKPAALTAARKLADRRIVLTDESTQRIRARHQVIAETLLDELQAFPSALYDACEQLAYSLASRLVPGSSQRNRQWRLLTRLINHRFLLRRIGVDSARRLFLSIEELLSWDYHYWLQRGTLEIDDGNIRLAERYLNTAYSLNPGDHLVVTAFAHMTMRKAVCEPQDEDAGDWIRAGIDMLHNQIATRGMVDYYPYHVLGAQTLAWAGKAVWPRAERLALVKDAVKFVKQGCERHPKNRGLAQLCLDLRTRVVAMESGML